MNRAIEELRSIEQERRETALEAERRKQEELETSMATLKASILEQQTAEQEKLTAAGEALRSLEEYKVLEVSHFGAPAGYRASHSIKRVSRKLGKP